MFRQRLPPSLGQLWPCLQPRRLKTGGGKNRFNLIRQRATQQHVDYLRQLDPPRPQRTAEIEPQLRSRVGDARTTFNHPEIMHQPTETALRSLEPRKSLHYEGRIREVQLEPFGVIEVHHADIFAFNDSLLKGPTEGKGSVARALVLPMASNLLPYRGLALEAFDRGGPELVKDTFHEAKARHSHEKKHRRQGDGEEVTEKEIHLEVGAAVEVPLHHLAPADLRQSLQSSKEAEYNKILFSIMPWFWEGSPMDAGKRLRFCAREAFAHAARHCKRVCDSVERSSGIYAQGCVVMPSLATGIFGYQPQDSCRALVEEAFEVLLQLEASEPNYSLHRICFVEANRDVADSFSAALTEVSRRWLPAHKVTTAAQWWGKQTRRLVVLPAVPNFFWRKFKIKFKRRHGVKKRERVNYIGNIKPFLWRAARVRQPPPLLVHQEDGGIAEDQLKARPYFFRGVSHWLFPSRRGGFHSMKRTSRGQWELRRVETVPEEAEFGHIEELRRKMAQQAAHLAEQAREVTRRFSDSLLQPDTDSPEAKPSKLPAAATESSDSAESDDGEEKATPRKPPREVAPSREGVPNEASSTPRGTQDFSDEVRRQFKVKKSVSARARPMRFPRQGKYLRVQDDV
eukprot:s1548_g6.t1